MSENCSHNCETCSAKCSSAKKTSLLAKPNAASKVQRVIGVVSGKGGVGKSLVTSLLTVTMQRRGFQTAVLDADITGPSIPKMFGVHEKAVGNETGILPAETKTGIRIMSVNLLLEKEDQPVIWRGPVIAGTVKQFWTDVAWGDVDYMFVDMPPGTGDVPLTVFQSLPIDGIIVVTSPQDLVSMIVSKAVKMAQMMNIPVVGLVENYSYLLCPDCGKKISVFGESQLNKVAAQYSLPILAQLPILPELAKVCDSGSVELFEGDFMENAAELLEHLPKRKTEE